MIGPRQPGSEKVNLQDENGLEDEKIPVFPMDAAGFRSKDLSDGQQLGTTGTRWPTQLCFHHCSSHLDQKRNKTKFKFLPQKKFLPQDNFALEVCTKKHRLVSERSSYHV